MSCSDNNKNADIKNATFDSLKNLSSFIQTSGYKNELTPVSYYSPFSEIAKTNPVITAKLNKDLDNLDNIDNIDDNKNNLFIKDNIGNNVYQNCTIQTNNPWFTTSSDYKTCEIVKNIVLDDKLKLNSDKTIITLDLKSKNKSKTAYCPYFSNVNIAYCENRWYDWIITPDYYLGNTYNKDNTKFAENDVYKCYTPCEKGYIPYKTEKGEFKCIPKKYYAGGIFANKLNYSPIGLINLIGNVAFKNETDDILQMKEKNPLYILYKNIIDYNIENKVDTNIYQENYIYTTHINSNLPNIDNLLKNDFNKNIYNEFEDVIKNNILNNFSDSNDQDYENINELTYKHKNFNENETEMYTFKGLDNCGALIPPILFHTWLLANIFIPLSSDNITTIKDLTIDTRQNPELKFLLYNKLFPKLNKIFDENKSNRLKNIFYKAVNVCYNGKTNFSINIIEKTKKSIDIYKDKYNIFLTYLNLHTTFTSLYNNPSLNNIIFNNEYKCYKDFELYDLYKSYNDVSDPNKITILDVLLKDDNKYKYFYSVEKLEKPTCENGYIYNSTIKECEPIVVKPVEDKNAPIEDEFDQFNIPELKNILTLFLKIIIVIIILYIIYIFYDIFGETILTVYNYLYMKFIEITSVINRYKATTFATSDEEVNKINAEIDYKLAAIEYQNLNKNTQKLKTYINENS